MSAPIRVLLVDDSVSIRNIIKVYLMQLGLEFIEAENGERAVQLARLMSPALIIADVNMPKMDGLQMLEQIRKTSGPIGKIPVLLLTGEREGDIEQRGMSLGANAFIRKPVAAASLVESVKKYLEVP